MISMSYRDAFGVIMFPTFSTKSIPVVVADMISPSLIESLMFFFFFHEKVFILSKAYYVVFVVLWNAAVAPCALPDLC